MSDEEGFCDRDLGIPYRKDPFAELTQALCLFIFIMGAVAALAMLWDYASS